ncbi:MAG: polysaccharide deacetylase family protein [Firmicutes bacterium]|nr:polysaccharide deacetylase family protein [Bacillota bacterium]
MKKVKKFFVVSILFLLVLSALGMTSDKTISWGLVHNENERTPGVPAGSAELLAEFDGLYVGNTGQKSIYLTFDLGYEAGYTAEVLDILKANNIKGVFFLCGHYLTETELVNRMIDEGHTIGNHTDRHKDLPTISAENIKKDIVDFDQKFVAAFGDKHPTMTFFRPPKGKFDRNTISIAKDQGLRTMMWTIAIKDWGKEPIPATSNAELIVRRIHPGAIILLHITNAGTPKMLEQLVPMALEKGYIFGVPSEL